MMYARIGVVSRPRRKRAKAHRIIRSDDGWGNRNVLRRTYSDPERLIRGAVFHRSETIRGKGNEALATRERIHLKASADLADRPTPDENLQRVSPPQRLGDAACCCSLPQIAFACSAADQ
jgi:hypothetical protein